MATKKAAKKSTKKSAKKSGSKSALLNKNLLFKIDWVKDPMPDLRRFLDQVALKRLADAKADFAAKVNEILKTGQR